MHTRKRIHGFHSSFVFFQKSFKLHAIDFIDLIDVHVVYARVMSDITQVIPHYIMDLYTEIYYIGMQCLTHFCHTVYTKLHAQFYVHPTRPHSKRINIKIGRVSLHLKQASPKELSKFSIRILLILKNHFDKFF